MDRATEIPMSDCGLTIACGEDGVWLHFSASDGKSAALNVSRIRVPLGTLSGETLDSWCADRMKQAAEIRASKE